MIEAFFCPSKITPDSDALVSDAEALALNLKNNTEHLNFFDWLAPNYEDLQGIIDPIRFQIHSIMLDILGVIEPSPRNVLDLGCGNGMLTQQVLELFADAHVYGVDNSLGMLESARSNLDEFSGQVTLAKADFRDPWEEILDEPLDAIIHYSALHHLPHDVLREVYTRLVKVLKPGGWFITGDVVAEKLPSAVEHISDRIRTTCEQSAAVDLGETNELLTEFEKRRKDGINSGNLTEHPVMAEQQVAWLIDAGFEIASRVYQDWRVSIFTARKPLK